MVCYQRKSRITFYCRTAFVLLLITLMAFGGVVQAYGEEDGDISVAQAVQIAVSGLEPVARYSVSASGQTSAQSNGGDYAIMPLYGAGTEGSGTSSIAIAPDGGSATALGRYAIAIGNSANASSTNTIAIGNGASATATASVAIGGSARASYSSGVAIGYGATLTSTMATAIGYSTSAAGNAVAIGYGSTATEQYTVSVGSTSTTRRIVNVSQGISDNDVVTVSQLSSVGEAVASAFGGTFEVDQTTGDVTLTGLTSGSGGGGGTGSSWSYEMGDSASAPGTSAFAIGDGATAAGQNNYAIGRNATTTGLDIYAIGTNASVIGASNVDVTHSYAIGSNAKVESIKNEDGETISTAVAAYAIGMSAEAYADNAYAIGANATSSQASAYAIGTNATADGYDAYAIGYGAESHANNSYAIGGEAKAYSTDSYAIGTLAETHGGYSFAIGDWAETSENATSSYAIGYEAYTDGRWSYAIGTEATANAEDSIALGYRAVADETYTISVGGGYDTENNPVNYRIVNMAAGLDEMDAVNVSQLNSVGTSVASALGGNSSYYFDTDTGTGSISTELEVGGQTYSSVQDALNALDGTTGGGAVAGNAEIVNGENIEITSEKITDPDSQEEITRYTVSLADDVTVADIVRINSYGITVNNSGGSAAITINGDNGINMGGLGISNMAIGVADSDAVNVSQITAVGDSVASAFGDGSSFVSNGDGTWTLDTNITVDGADYGTVQEAIDAVIGYVDENGGSGSGTGGGAVAGNASISQGSNIEITSETTTSTDPDTGETTTSTDYTISVTDNPEFSTVTVNNSSGENTVTISGDSGINMAGTDITNAGTVSAANVNVSDSLTVADVVRIDNSGITMGSYTMSGTSDGFSMGGGRLTGLADGGIYQGSTDAVTGNQLWQAYNRMDEIRESVNIVGAHAAALSGLHPIQYNPYEPTTLTAAVGTYRDAYAFAVGAFHYVRENVLINIGASVSDDSDVMGRAGISFSVGPGGGRRRADLYTDLQTMRAELAQMRVANDELTREISILKYQLAGRDVPDDDNETEENEEE